MELVSCLYVEKFWNCHLKEILKLGMLIHNFIFWLLPNASMFAILVLIKVEVASFKIFQTFCVWCTSVTACIVVVCLFVVTPPLPQYGGTA